MAWLPRMPRLHGLLQSLLRRAGFASAQEQPVRTAHGDSPRHIDKAWQAGAALDADTDPAPAVEPAQVPAHEDAVAVLDDEPSPLERLIKAADAYSIADVKAALHDGAPVDDPGHEGLNALQIAASHLDADMFELLLDHGAQLHAPCCLRKPVVGIMLDVHFETPEEEWPQITELCLRAIKAEGLPSPIPKDWLFTAAMFGDARLLATLLAHGGDALVQDHEGRGLLHAAAKANSLATCLELLRRGLHTDLHDNDGKTPLHLAVAARCLSSACVLVAMGASTDGVYCSSTRYERVLKARPLAAAVMSWNPDVVAEAIARREDGSDQEFKQAIALVQRYQTEEYGDYQRAHGIQVPLDIEAMLRSALASRHARSALNDAVAQAQVH